MVLTFCQKCYILLGSIFVYTNFRLGLKEAALKMQISRLLEQIRMALKAHPKALSFALWIMPDQNNKIPGGITLVLLSLIFTPACNHLLPGPVQGTPQNKAAIPTFPPASPISEFKPTNPAAPSPTRNAILHTVKKGDTLSSIADESGVPIEIIMALNNLEMDGNLLPGTELILGYATPTIAFGTQGNTKIVPLTMETSADDIRRCLLNGEATWDTLWADALITTTSKGLQHVEREQAWLQPGSSRWLSGLSGSQPALLWITDLGKTTQINLQSGEIQEFETGGGIPSQLNNLLSPSRFAVRGGDFQTFNTEPIAGRQTVAVEWTNDENRLIDRLWIDIEKCVVLRWVHLPREFAEASGRIIPSEILITSIVFDETFDQGLFKAQPPYPQDFANDHRTP